MSKNPKTVEIPDSEQVKTEIKRVRLKSRYFKVLRSTVYALIVTAAVSVLIATLFLPVLQIYGSSMAPTLEEGDIVVSVKRSSYEPGQVIAFYYSNKVLVKRIIATEFDVVDIAEDGTITVNNEPVEDLSFIEKHYGEATNIEFPYHVPENSYFVVGDSRDTSVDSRNSNIGCVIHDDVVGKIILTVWPFNNFGSIE